jgi:hypothetical protein
VSELQAANSESVVTRIKVEVRFAFFIVRFRYLQITHSVKFAIEIVFLIIDHFLNRYIT